MQSFSPSLLIEQLRANDVLSKCPEMAPHNYADSDNQTHFAKDMPQLRTSDSEGVNLALATCSMQVQMRYCEVTGFDPAHVSLSKEDSFYTASIKLDGLTCQGSGQFVGQGGWVPRFMTDTFQLIQLENAEWMRQENY